MRYAAALLVLVCAVHASAQNLLVSPDFDVASDVLDWPDPFPDPNTTVSWEASMDLNSSPTSGSLQLDSSVSNGGSDGPRQCVDTGPGDYHAEAWVFNPTQVNPRTASIFVQYYPDPGCSGVQFPSDFQLAPGGFDVWEKIELDVTAPAGAQSIGMRLMAGVNFDPTPSVMFYDAARLEKVPTPQQSFTGTVAIPFASPFLAVPGASASGAGIGVSRRVPLNEVNDFDSVTGFTGAFATALPTSGAISNLVLTGIGDPSFLGATSLGPLRGKMAVRGFLQRVHSMSPGRDFTFPLTSMGTAGLGLGGTLGGPGGETVVFGTWTTGMVSETNVLTSLGGGLGTYSATGSDLRTASGAGTLQLVTPMRVLGNPSIPTPNQALIATLTLTFAPEPGRVSLLASGSLALFALGWRRRRRSS